ncbi:MAG: hypothetical protein LBJ82_02390 [Deltaproteobacteria bacterium]|jgi:hypothetical protein|nr:hypothetical protein [Deltaproteobacteria bacterium]
MRSLQPAALAGFALNCAVILFLFVGMNAMDFSMHPREVQEIIAAYANSSAFYIFYLLCLAAQAAGMWLIATRRAAGLALALVSGLILLPLSLPYILGCLGSHFSAKFSALAAAPADFHKTRIFRPAIKKFIWGLCAAGTALSIALLSTGWTGYAFLFTFSLSLAAMHLAFKGSRQSPLTLSDSFFVLSPHVLAARVAVPYAAVRAATLQDDGVLRLKIRTDQGEVTLRWPLISVLPSERDEALRSLGSALKDHGAALY